jgi:hypothetical protein
MSYGGDQWISSRDNTNAELAHPVFPMDTSGVSMPRSLRQKPYIVRH